MILYKNLPFEFIQISFKANTNIGMYNFFQVNNLINSIPVCIISEIKKKRIMFSF